MRVRLKSLRTDRNLTQQQMADLIGIERSTYANIELGNKNPSFSVAIKIKQILKYSDDDIFLATDVSKGNNVLKKHDFRSIEEIA